MSRQINPITREIIANRKCCKCGEGTYKYTENRIQWHRELDEDGKWTGRWLCNNCYTKDYTKKRNRENERIRAAILKKKREEGKI